MLGTNVYVLTHHPRPPLPMGGGTTFHFIDATAFECKPLACHAGVAHARIVRTASASR